MAWCTEAIVQEITGCPSMDSSQESNKTSARLCRKLRFEVGWGADAKLKCQWIMRKHTLPVNYWLLTYICTILSRKFFLALFFWTFWQANRKWINHSDTHKINNQHTKQMKRTYCLQNKFWRGLLHRSGTTSAHNLAEQHPSTSSGSWDRCISCAGLPCWGIWNQIPGNGRALPMLNTL